MVTGLGVLSPIGNDVPTFWHNLLAGVSGAKPITSFDVSDLRTRFACQIEGFNPDQFLDKKELRRLDPFVWYAVAVCEEALRDSGILEFRELDRSRVGVFWSSGIGGILTFMEEVAAWGADKSHRFPPLFIPKVIINTAAGYISIRYGFSGPNFSPVSACASSAHAIAEALLHLRAGTADVIIAGGSEAPINYIGIAGFSAMRALSERNDDPKTASRPYDKDRDGFVMGEGAAALVLETLEHALRRGAKIYAELSGAGQNADAYHLTAPVPDGARAAEVMLMAIRSAGLTPEDIDYINAHGTSTPLGDVAEVNAIKKAFGEHAYKLNISSTKSMTGHLLGAAGALESVVCVLAVKHDVVPPTINHFTDDPEIDPNMNFTFWKPQKRQVRHAINNSFGFGGHNVSLVFSKFSQ